MWYKASIVAEVDSVKKYILVLCVNIYMAGRLANMLGARSIVVFLQGCSSHYWFGKVSYQLTCEFQHSEGGL